MSSASAPAVFSAAAAQSKFEQAVALSLHTWSALTLAVQNSWGGEDSSDKRDWFAGAVAELFAPFERVVNGVAVPKDVDDSTTAPEEPDTEYVEEFLLQVMLDEFDVNVDDESGFDVAQQIVRFRTNCAKGDFQCVNELRTKWESKRGKKVQAVAQPNPDGEDDDDDDSAGSEDWEDDEDVEMDEAPQLVAASKSKDKPEPEVDEDGFTKVTRKR